MEAAVRALPKIELHAHLHGCIRLSTLSELLAAHDKPPVPPHWKTMTCAFGIFTLTHSVVTSPQVVYRITKEVIEDFANDGVVYLELRTTPRGSEHMTKEEYLAAVIKAIEEAAECIIVRLLLSVNRAQDLAAAHKALELTAFSPLIVGMDFSGDPHVSKFNDFREVFEAARERGLKTTVHTAEIEDAEELGSILAFRPDRLGHCCYLDAIAEQSLLVSPIPMEICLSSNMGTQQLGHVSEHHFQRFFAREYPLAVCTDDTTVFATTLTQELMLLVNGLGLSLEDVKRLVKMPTDFIFDQSDEVREKLDKVFQSLELSKEATKLE